jgi:hypothetical protein
MRLSGVAEQEYAMLYGKSYLHGICETELRKQSLVDSRWLLVKISKIEPAKGGQVLSLNFKRKLFRL